MTPAVLTARDLTKSYGTGDTRFDALRGVSLSIERGESVAIIGKSGSGKSTLMHVLALLDEPSTGSLDITGQDAAALSTRQLNTLRNQAFGFVFQQFFLTPHATVLENVMLPLSIARIPVKERQRRALEVLERVDLSDKARSKAINLSGGQKQRVAIARAIVNNPSVVFADEPTGNLDTATGAVVEDLLFELNRESGITLVIVTHDEELADRCDRKIFLRDGQLAA